MNPFDHIEDYLAGTLSPADTQAFDDAMRTDSALRDLVDNYANLKHVNEGMLEVELFEQVKEVARTRKERNPDYAAGNHIIFYLGAALVIALFSWYFYHNPIETTYDKEKPTNEKLMADAYRPPIWPITKSGPATAIQRAVSTYLDGNVAGAKSQLLAIKGDDAIMARYWLSEMMAEQGDLSEVKKYLPTAAELPSKAERIRLLENMIKRD